MRYIPENYLNTGVLLMNLPQIRTQYNLIQGSFNFFKRYTHVSEWPDQDFLNMFLNRDVFL